MDFRSLGAAGVYVRVDAIDGPAMLNVPIDPEVLSWYQPSFLRLAHWNAAEKRFEILQRSRINRKGDAIQAKISTGGIYGVFGYSRLPHVFGFQRRLCAGNGIATIEPGLFDRLCPVILCGPYDAHAWGEVMASQTGESLPPASISSEFQSICEQCFGGRPELIDFPECWIDLAGPDDDFEPPELEELPIGLGNGGRAVAIAVHPADDDRMIVASETGGLFATRDRGVTWRHVSEDTTFFFTDVRYVPTDPNIVVATAERDTRVESGGGIYRSVNGGSTWSQVEIVAPTEGCDNEFAAFALDYELMSDRLWAGTKCGAAFSDDAGATWEFLPSVAGYDLDPVTAIIAPAPDHLKICVGSGVSVTADGGATWFGTNSGLPNNRRGGLHAHECRP